MKEHIVEIYMKVFLPDDGNICTFMSDNVLNKEEIAMYDVTYVQSKTAEEGAWILK